MTFNRWTFLFEAINFVVLAYILNRLLYRPLRAAVEKRREADNRARNEAEQTRREAVSLRRQLDERLAAIDRERQELIHAARVQAAAERQTVLDETERQTRRRAEEVRQGLEREREDAIKSMRGELTDHAIELTRRLLAEASDRTLDQQLALRLAGVLNELPGVEREQIRTGWRPGDDAILEIAGELDARTLEVLTAAASDITGQPLALLVRRRPDLLAGVRLLLAGHVWDGSLAGQLPAASDPREKVSVHGGYDPNDL